MEKVFTSGHYRISEHEIEDVLHRTGLRYKRSGADQFVAEDCPFCEANGKPIMGRPDNRWKCYFTRESGAYFCHRCGAKGSLFDYKKAMGLVAPTAHFSGQAKEFKLPEQGVVNSYPMALEYDESVVNYALTQRKIRKETLEWYKVGSAQYSFQDDKGNWIPETCVTFPWIEFTSAQKELTVRVKARSLADKSHMRLDPTGGRWGFFGWHTVPNSAKQIVITEGEWDAMAVYQATKDTGVPMPAISLPNGSRSLPPELLPYLERFERIYLWMDDDVSGMHGAADFARKLGDRRTWIIQTKLGKSDGPKDANECLQRGQDIYARLDASKPIPHDQIIQLADLKAEIYREILNPSETNGTPIDFLPKLQKIVKGHRRGELTVLTGGTGQGKTTILAQHSLELAKRGERTCWGSFEIKNHRLGKKMLYQFAEKTLARYPGELDAAWEKFTQLPMWMMKFFGSTGVDKVLDAMDYATYVYDVSHFILDNLQFMTSGQGKGINKFDVQDEAISKLRDFATARNVHITIVIHPKKITEGVEMDTSSLGGTAKAGQEADNVWVLQKGPWYRYLDVRKNRYDGDLGLIPYEYNFETHRIRELTDIELDEKKSQEPETGETHGMVSQTGGRTGGGKSSYGAASRRKKQPAPEFQPNGYPTSPSRGPVFNAAPGADNSAYHRQFSPGTKQD